MARVEGTVGGEGAHHKQKRATHAYHRSDISKTAGRGPGGSQTFQSLLQNHCHRPSLRTSCDAKVTLAQRFLWSNFCSVLANQVFCLFFFFFFPLMTFHRNQRFRWQLFGNFRQDTRFPQLAFKSPVLCFERGAWDFTHFQTCDHWEQGASRLGAGHFQIGLDFGAHTFYPTGS